MAELQIGDIAPDFELPRDGGGTMSLQALRGRPVVLYAYPKDDTSGCTAQAVDFTTLKPAFEQKGITVVGISPDSAKKHDKFKQKHGLDVDLIADEEKTTLQALGVWKEKSMYGRKYMGVERSTFLIDKDGRLAQIWRKVSVPGHAQEVLAAAEQLV
ncbi:peroxiredoxin [Tianweitania sediminis]|uniref:thioredoxin-dependent peroxiredoxin n=1 Tax=Tianweitania sediminis TaxID=1502156 RepID=A0A8J7ULQ8_9HYPH|nr:peroxiredoxin [Tianweitania sediminis]MBP0440999.1 peroxiredoxin [Tianweitania sediminis]